jgi:hypothetical protein
MSSTPPNSPSPDPDELARALAALEHRGQVRIAQSEKVSETGVTRLWELGTVARVAMRETARFAQLEAELNASAPLAAARLRLVSDVAAVCAAALVAHTARAMLTDPSADDQEEQ